MFSLNGLLKFTGSPKYGFQVVRFNRNVLYDFESEQFFKNPLGECLLYHCTLALHLHFVL